MATTLDTLDEVTGQFKSGWRHAQRGLAPLFTQTAGGFEADPDMFDGDEEAAEAWTAEGRRLYVAGYNAYTVSDDEPLSSSERAAEMRAEYASEQDESDRNDAWGMP